LNQEKFDLIFGTGHSFDRVILPETVALIERWELFMPTRYPDGKNADGTVRYSIGFGHAEHGDHEPKIILNNMVLTIEQAREILTLDIATKARFVNTRIKVPLTNYMYGALVSLVYQSGQGRVDREGTIIPLLNEGNYVKAAVAMLAMNKKMDGTVIDGLTLRRATEVGFFMTKR
jgi:GH24 family phage-related lysozyme (muramidase)